MNIARFTGLRNVLRWFGINKLLSLGKIRAMQAEIKYYRRLRPIQASMNVHGVHINLYTGDEQEWIRARSLESDAHIVSPMIECLKDKKNGIYWDIGSSIGAYAILMSKIVDKEGSVIAFEPEQKSFEKLTRNISLNSATNITPIPVALGEKQEYLQFVPAENPSEGTHHLVDGHSKQHERSQSIEVVPIDTLRMQRNLDIPTVVKIDVEGWEEKVIRGGLKTFADKQCAVVVVEVHFAILASAGDNGAPQRIIDLLRSCQFQHFQWLDPSHLQASK